jgi:hypothetical protein
MGMVMIRCPNTGKEVATGIETDAASFAHVRDVLVRSPCPYCGLEHVWWTREAWLSEPSASAGLPVDIVARHAVRRAKRAGRRAGAR